MVTFYAKAASTQCPLSIGDERKQEDADSQIVAILHKTSYMSRPFWNVGLVSWRTSSRLSANSAWPKRLAGFASPASYLNETLAK